MAQFFAKSNFEYGTIKCKINSTITRLEPDEIAPVPGNTRSYNSYYSYYSYLQNIPSNHTSRRHKSYHTIIHMQNQQIVN